MERTPLIEEEKELPASAESPCENPVPAEEPERLPPPSSKLSFDKGLTTIAHTLLAANLLARSLNLKQQQHTDAEKAKEADMSQEKTSPTLLETYKEDPGIVAQANLYQLPESPDVQQEPICDSTMKDCMDKNLIKMYCEAEYKKHRSAKKPPFDKAFSFENDSIKQSLLELRKSAEPHALKIFKLILKYTKDIPANNKSQFAKILSHIFSEEPDPRLRDEVFCQLYKQTVNNPNEKSCRRTWKLLAILVGFILPTSKKLFDALVLYTVQSYEKTPAPDTNHNIRYAFNRLVHAYPRGERRYYPTQEELGYLRKYKSYPVWVQLLNGVKSCYTCHTYTTCGDIKKAVMKKFGLSFDYIGQYHIYEFIVAKRARCERLLMDSDKVFDVLSAWQIELASRKDAKDVTSFQLLFKITLLAGADEKCVNTCTLQYLQFDYYFMNTEIRMERKDMLTICGLKARMLGKPPESRDAARKAVKERMDEIVPKHVLEDTKDATLLLKVAKLWMRLDSYRLHDCKLAVLERASKMSSAHSNRFFCATEKQVYESFAKDNVEVALPSSVMIIICPQEVSICDVQGEELDSLNLGILLSWCFDDSQITFIVCKETKEQSLTFSTQQGPFIDFLLKGYARLLAKKDVRGLSIRKEDVVSKYASRADPGYIKKQRLGYQLVYDML